MADDSLKEKKLAAARKKLRKYQKRKDDTSKQRESPLSVELLGSQKSETSSSRSSSVADMIESESNHRLDVLEHKPKLDSFEYINPLQSETVTCTSEKLSCDGAHFTTDVSSSFKVPYSPHEPVDSSSNASPLVSLDPSASRLYKSSHEQVSEYIEQNMPKQACDNLENEGSVCSETNASMTTVVHVKNSDSLVPHTQEGPLRSTTESLRQLSLQMRGLVNDVEIQDPDRQGLTIIELEKRNNELAALLETEKQKTFESHSIISELKRTVESQNLQIQHLQKISVTENSGTEVNGLREQLQVHIQTIGILVAEKSELQTSLSHVRYALDQKVGETTELQGRLEASRQHVKTLESSNQDLKNQLSSLTDSKETDSQQLLNLQSNYAKLSKLCDEMRASTAELTERLAVRSEENQKLNSELAEVRRQYEMDQVHIEQLRNNSTEELRNQFQEVQSSFIESQNEIQMLKTSLETAQNEKKHLEYEYKSYTSQLAADSEDMKQQLSKTLKKREELEDRIQELELDLKSKTENPNSAVSLVDVEKEKAQMAQMISDLTESKRQLDQNCSSLTRDNKQLSQFLADQSAKLELLESAAERSSTQQVDTTQLLQAMQSDKVAAARALTQNKQLKEELEELQNGFILMSNKKLELTEKLEKELHIKKSLYKEISQLGEEVNLLKTNLLHKQREIESVGSISIIPNQNSVESTSKEVQVTSECRDNGEVVSGCEHGESHHDHSEYIFQTIRKADIQPHTTVVQGPMQEAEPVDVSVAEEAIESSSLNASTEDEMNYSKQDPEKKISSPLQEISCLRVAHEALEKRFLKCMRDLATVSDEKQNLEHLVQQLELETETVGDYITIYQFQRGVMKQQVQELKTELEMLKTEKQETISKLSMLQKLVESLASSADKDALKLGFIHGINSIINAANPEKDTANDETASKSQANVSLENGTSETSAPKESDESDVATQDNMDKKEKFKTDTVKQIIDLISEMECSSHVDTVALHKFHPCAHCSGRLITI